MAPKQLTYHISPIALRMAKTLWSFGLSECNRVKNFNAKWDPETVANTNTKAFVTTLGLLALVFSRTKNGGTHGGTTVILVCKDDHLQYLP